MIQMRNQGKTLQQIGDVTQLTRERVRQILKSVGYVGKPDIPQQRQYIVSKADRLQRRIAFIRRWKAANPDKVAAYRRASAAKMRKDKAYVICKNLSRRITAVLRGEIKSGRTVELLGCTSSEFVAYLESRFQPGMSWSNYGVMGWHVDHIVSCWRFDLSDPEQQRKCFHYTNLQPLWREDNLSKRDHWRRAS